MDIYYDNETLHDSIENQKNCKARYGILAKAIQKRLNELSAYESLSQWYKFPGRFEELHGNRKGQISIHLSKNWRLIFVPFSKEELDFFPNNQLDWSCIKSIKIIEIEDYH